MTIECSNPYPGPESFARGDDRPYFGREQETTDLSSLAVTERLLVFYAPSGAGKTSLLNKRLIPRLEEKLYEVLPTARVSGAASLPANVRNVYAYNLMTRIVRDDPEPERFAGLSLSEFLWHVSTEDGQTYFYDPGDTALRIATAARDLWPRVLILDQFEEVVTSYPGKWQHREEFFRQLDEALGADPMLRVVMSLRSDYVQGLERYAGLLRYGLRARYQMLLMGTGDALKAIEGPAEACGRAFVPGVARQLVKNMSQLLDLDAEGRPFTVEGETVEPIQLQVVCYQLWESMKGTPGDRIEMEDLRRLARAARPEASAALAGVEDENKLLSDFVDDALSAFYERSLAESLAAADAEVEEAFLRNWFSTQLITEGGARGFMQRGHDETGGVPEAVVQELVDNHLLRSDTRGSVRLVELIHDRFVEPIRTANLRWSQKRRREQPWIDAAWNWYESGDNPATRSGPLLEGAALAAVLVEVEGHQLEPAVQEYIDVSKAAQAAREQEAALNAERIKAEEATRSAGQLRRRGIALAALAGGVFLLLLVVIYLAINLKRSNDDLTLANTDLTDKQKVVEEQKEQLGKSNRELGAKNIALEASERAATAARDENRSLTLADQSRNISPVEDRLLLASAAISYANTLAANGALLEALDEGYRNADHEIAPYTPHETVGVGANTNLQSLAFSGDGSLLAAGDESGGIFLWDNLAGQRIGERLHAAGTAAVSSLALDLADRRLASATGNRYDPDTRAHKLILWDLEDRAAPRPVVLAANQPSIWSVDISPDGDMLATALQTGAVALWDLAGSTPVSRTLSGETFSPALTVAFDAGSQRLAAGWNDGQLVVWDDPSSARPVSRSLEGHTAAVNDVAFSADGSNLISASDDGTIRLWDLTTDMPVGRVLDDRSHDQWMARRLALSPAGSQLAVSWVNSGDAGAIQLYDLDQPGQPSLEIAATSGAARDLTFDPAASNDLLSANAYETSPWRWKLAGMSQFAVTRSLTGVPDTELQAFSPDGRWLAAVDANNQIYLGETGANSWPVSFTVAGNVTALAVNPSGQELGIAVCAATAPSAPATPTPVPTKPEQVTDSSPTPTATPLPVAPSGESECAVQIWSVRAGQPVTTVQTIAAPEPVSALVFHPRDATLLAVGGQRGEVQVRLLPSGEVVQRMEDPVPGLTDLSFSMNGERLAALGERGLLHAWTWQNGVTIHESEASEGEQGATRFTAVTFVNGWLAVAAADPVKIQLWTVGQAEPVSTPLVLAAGRVSDLVFDPGQQMLTVIQPSRIVHWPMSQGNWLALACTRAGRNLGYDAWLRAFPGQNSFAAAKICDYSLDASFASQMVTEANRAIDDCTPEQWDKGMAMLEEARTLDVQPPLDLDPLAEAIDVLSARALAHLQQRSESYDAQAVACLQLASDKLAEAGNAAFNVASALEAGRQQVALESLLSDQQPDDMDELLRDVAWIEEHRSQWPGDLSTSMVQPGQEISGRLAADQTPTYFFVGKRGQAVTIAMDAVDGGLDPYLVLEGDAGRVVREDDDSGDGTDSLIKDSVLPADGVYRIRPQAFSGQGAFRLSLQARDLPAINFDAPVQVQGGQGAQWLMQAKEGQIVALAMETSESVSDTFLTLEQLDGSWSSTGYASATGAPARIVPVPLPADAVYVVTVNLNGSMTPYTVTLRQVEPPALDLGKVATSALASDAIWTFSGQPGQIISATLVTSDTAAQPAFDILSARGAVLKSTPAAGATGAAALSGYILPDAEPFYIRVSGLEGSTPYRLLIDGVEPAALQIGQTVSSTTGGITFWTLDGQPDQVVQINLDAAEGTGLDTLLRLLGRDGKEIAYDDDGGAGYNSRLTLILPETPGLLVQADRYEGAGAFTLSVSKLATEPLPVDGSSVSFVSDRAWTLEGEAGQMLTIDILDSGDGSYASLKLVTSDGKPVGSSDGSASLVSVLPDGGTYYILPRFDLDYGVDLVRATVMDAADAANLDEAASQTLYRLATANAIDEALGLYRWGTADGAVQFTADARMALCWHGALRGAIGDVFEVCEDLPDSAEASDPSVLAMRRDVRGLARALSGNKDGAIEDFEVFVASGYDSYQVEQRREWVQRLRADEPVSAIFDEATLEALLQQ